MSFTYVSSNTGGTSTTTANLTVNYPASISGGNMIAIVISTGSNVAMSNPTVPSNWSLAYSSLTSGLAKSVWVYLKPGVGGETSDTITFGTANTFSYVTLNYSQTLGYAFDTGTSNLITSATTTFPTTATTVANANSIILGIWNGATAAASVSSFPATMTERTLQSASSVSLCVGDIAVGSGLFSSQTLKWGLSTTGQATIVVISPGAKVQLLALTGVG